MYINWDFVEVKKEEIPFSISNRAFAFGDGFFETMIWKDGGIRFYQDHWERIQEGLKAFEMEAPTELTKESLSRYISSLLQKNGLTDNARVRLQLWRSGGGRYTPEQDLASICISTSEHRETGGDTSVNLGLYRNFRTFRSPISHVKRLNAQPYIMAAKQAKKRKVDDLILLDERGKISECISSNIFWLVDGIVFTPALSTGCVNGIARRNIIRQLEQWEVPLQEVRQKPDILKLAEAIFTTNVTGIKAVRQLENIDLQPDHPLIQQLQQKLFSA